MPVTGQTFEQRLLELQDLIQSIESGTLPLEESVHRFEKGMKIVKALDSELQDLNRKLTVLREGRDGAEEAPMAEKT